MCSAALRACLVTLGLALLLWGRALEAQCQQTWQAGPADSGVEGQVWALLVEPDGEILVAGQFLRAGGVSASNIVRWTGEGWEPLGSGTNGIVRALTSLPNGDVVIGGYFTEAGGVVVNGIARWDGSEWHAMGSGIAGHPPLGFSGGPTVLALLRLSSGDLIASGQFTSMDGVPTGSIARWNGNGWSAVGSGVNGFAGAIAELPNGDLLAGGIFSSAGGAAAKGLARWDGSAWSEFEGGVVGGAVRAIRIAPNGDVIVAGEFYSIGNPPVQASNAARWNGAAWQPRPQATPIRTLSILSSGELFAGSDTSPRIAKLHDPLWRSVGMGFPSMVYGGGVAAIADVPGMGLVVGGNFDAFGAGPLAGSPAPEFFTSRGLAVWNDGRWDGWPRGTTGRVGSLALLPGGEVLASGDFTWIGDVQAHRLARWDGAAWHPFGAAENPRVEAVATRGDGLVAVAGHFESERHVALWTGGAWQPLGFVDGRVHALRFTDEGLIAAGAFWNIGGVSSPRVARWDGGGWSAMHGLSPHEGMEIRSIAELADGRIVVGGKSVYSVHQAPGNFVLGWETDQWAVIADVVGEISGLETLPSGELVAAGMFSEIGGVSAASAAMWNGSDWSELPGLSSTYPVHDLHVDVFGRIFTAQTSYGGTLRRWTGAGWELVPGVSAQSNVNAVAGLPDGSLMIGGRFAFVGGELSANVAVLGCSCYADCDASGTLSVEDFACFLGHFASGQPYANCDRSTQAPFFTVADFSCFLNRFAAGCE